MKANIGNIDRTLRFIFGVLMLFGGYFYNVWVSVVGAMLILTAILKWCPPYALFGISTCPRK